MTSDNYNSLWRDFPKTTMEFEAWFATEEDCRADSDPLGPVVQAVVVNGGFSVRDGELVLDALNGRPICIAVAD